MHPKLPGIKRNQMPPPLPHGRVESQVIGSITSRNILSTIITTGRGDKTPSLRKHNITKIIKETRSAIELAKEPSLPLHQEYRDQKIIAIVQHTKFHTYAAAQAKKREKTADREELVPIPAQRTTQQATKIKGKPEN